MGKVEKKENAANTIEYCGLQTSSTSMSENLLEMQILRPHPRPAESGPLCGGVQEPIEQALQVTQRHSKVWEPLVETRTRKGGGVGGGVTSGKLEMVDKNPNECKYLLVF